MPISTPNYLTQDTQGRVGAQFTGHISAAGLELIAGVAASPPADRRIRWHKTDYNGALTAEILSYSDGALTWTDLSAINSDTVNQEARAVLNARDADGSSRTQLWARNFPTSGGAGNAGAVQAFFPKTGAVATLLTEQGYSSFPLTDGSLGQVLGSGNNIQAGNSGTITIPGGASKPSSRLVMISFSLTSYAAVVGGGYFTGFQIPTVGAATNDFYLNVANQHLPSQMTTAVMGMAPGTYSISPFTNMTMDPNDRFSFHAVGVYN